MASTTQNIGLVLPDGNENVSRQVLNDNFTMIDGAIGNITDTSLPTVTGTETVSGVMTISVACQGFAFTAGLSFPILFPNDIETENASTLMMNVGGSGAKYLELHVTRTTTFQNISAGVHFVECSTTPLSYSSGTETYELYQTGTCGKVDGVRVSEIIKDTAGKNNTTNTWSAGKLYDEFSKRTVHVFSYTINANNSNMELMWGLGTAWTGDFSFTDNARVVGYTAEHPEYLKDFRYTINEKSFIPHAAVMPGAPSQKVEFYIVETTTGVG